MDGRISFLRSVPLPLLPGFTSQFLYYSLFLYLPVFLYLQMKLHPSLTPCPSKTVPAPSISPAQLPCRQPKFNYRRLCDNPRPPIGHCSPPLREHSRVGDTRRQSKKETREERGLTHRHSKCGKLCNMAEKEGGKGR